MQYSDEFRQNTGDEHPQDGQDAVQSGPTFDLRPKVGLLYPELTYLAKFASTAHLEQVK